MGIAGAARAAWATVVVGALALGASAALAAGCSRPIKVLAGSVRQIEIDGNKVGGALGALLEQLARDAGCTFQYIEAPITRGVLMLGSGEIDIIPAAAQSAERDRGGEFIPFAHARVVAIGLAKRLAAIGPLDAQLNGSYRVGVFRGADYGTAYRDLIRPLEQQGRLEYITVVDSGLKMLLAGRVDVIVAVPVSVIGVAPAPELTEQLQAVALEGIPRITVGFYLSRHALSAADAAILRTGLRNPAFLKRVYLSQLSLLPAWARNTIQPTE